MTPVNSTTDDMAANWHRIVMATEGTRQDSFVETQRWKGFRAFLFFYLIVVFGTSCFLAVTAIRLLADIRNALPH